jgi:hypothetical protein
MANRFTDDPDARPITPLVGEWVPEYHELHLAPLCFLCRRPLIPETGEQLGEDAEEYAEAWHCRSLPECMRRWVGEGRS